MIEANNVSTLFAIAARAIEVAEAEETRRFKADDLAAAYNTYRERNRLDYIERESNDWHLMLASAEKEYQALQKAKRVEYNAQRRLKTAILRHRGLGFSLIQAVE